jgi:FkbM family methyltransferase
LNASTARIFPLALADCDGQAELIIAGYGHEGLNTLGAFSYEAIETAHKERIEVIRLDDVVSQTPLARLDLIKLDVEGAETRLLKGAAVTLERYRPVVLFEASEASLRNQGSSREELLDTLRALEYVTYLFDPYSGLPSEATSGSYSDNMIAVPVGRVLPDAVFVPWPQVIAKPTSCPAVL